MNREREGATRETVTNPQAFACLGITLLSGLVGVFFGVFLTDTVLRISIAGVCFVLFVAGVVGHVHFKKKESEEGFRSSSGARRLVGYAFVLSMVLAIAFVVFTVAQGDILHAILPIAYTIGIFPFVRRLLP